MSLLTLFRLPKAHRLILTAGFALFAMFFGSGNLIFPLSIGIETQNHWPLAAIGLLMTGIIVPFLGLYSVATCWVMAKKSNFFEVLGPRLSFLLILLMLLLLGPVAVGPRCVLVAAGGLQLLYPSLPTFGLGLGICLFVFGIIYQPNRLVDTIGKYLTPLLLGCLGLLTIYGLSFGPNVESITLSNNQAFFNGLNQGYQTMDLLAAFFFSVTTLEYIHLKLEQTGQADKQGLLGLTMKACCIGALLLSLVYFAFILLGAKYAALLSPISPEKRIVVLASEIFGTYGTPLVGLLVALACITTLSVLSQLFADFCHVRVFNKKMSNLLTTFLTLTVTFIISLIGFDSLANYIATVLVVLYPALIIFTVARLVQARYNLTFNLSKFAFWLSAGGSYIIRYLI